MPAAESLPWSGRRLEAMGGQLGACGSSLESAVRIHNCELTIWCPGR